MQNIKLVYLTLIILSASIICFEIISTRVTSVIFVSNYAFIILSFAILGLGSGAIYSYYKINIKSEDFSKTFFRFLLFTGSSMFLFISTVTILKISNPFFYFLLLFLPFFFAGVLYSLFFRIYADKSFKIYASDLCGAALGAIASLFLINTLGASNTILLLSSVILLTSGSFVSWQHKKKQVIIFYTIFSIVLVFLTINGQNSLLGKIPIGKFPEKDFYYVYPNAESISEVIESRWSLYGRSDLIQYTNQDMVKQLFIDGAAGSQMYRFNGNVKDPGSFLYNLLLVHSNSIPFLLMNENEKDNMLIIGPGGGKEVLIGLFGGVKEITGIEVNPDFVNIVKDYKDFNGGIYTDFPNVNIKVAEGRNYVKQDNINYDLIVMALPSTEQLQNIDNLAASENFLLTVEAINDYLKILTPEGQLIFTVHNNWELMRLIITTIYAFKEAGIDERKAIDHFLILENEYSPTIVIKKNPYTKNETDRILSIVNSLLKGFPAVTYLPYVSINHNSFINNFLNGLKNNQLILREYIDQHQYDISPCRDDSPYFYKINRGVSEDYVYLFSGVAFFNFLIIIIPLTRLKKLKRKEKKSKNDLKVILLLLTIFISLGVGFMMLEISLFQKMILYLGSPTISLSILLSSLLIGMGIGSLSGEKLYKENHFKRLITTSTLIVGTGLLLFIFYPLILENLLKYSLIYRATVSFILIFPLGILLGIPFPTGLQILRSFNQGNLIPWMYGVNGSMSVLGSVLAVNLSLILGFTPTFFIGISIYLILALILSSKSRLKLY